MRKCEISLRYWHKQRHYQDYQKVIGNKKIKKNPKIQNLEFMKWLNCRKIYSDSAKTI